MIALNKISKEEFGKLLIPEKILLFKYKKNLTKTYEKVYYDNLNHLVIANLFIASQLIALVIYLLIYLELYIAFASFIDQGAIQRFIFIFSSFSITSFISYYALLIGYFVRVDSKYRKAEQDIERDLPEFIDALVSNLKGGISLEKALLQSVRKEQVTLLKEVTLINEKIFMGKTSLEAIQEFRMKYDSQILSRTVFLLEEGIRGGGNLAHPLERISENLKRIYSLNEEIKGNASGFAIVIQAISIIIAPLLFALAITLLTFIGNLLVLLQDSGTQLLQGMGEGLPPEYPFYLITFSYAMIALITLFSSLITSQLKGEKVFVAFKYMPIYVGISMFIYATFKTILLNFFGGILG